MARPGSGQSSEPGALARFPTWVAGTQTLRPHSVVFTGALAGSWIRSGAAGARPSAPMGCWCCRWWLYPLCHNAGLGQEDLRVDGRGCEDYRCVEVETDVVSNTSGSARVKLGHTDILVGVKAEMGTPKLEKPDEGYVEFFVDCSANATPEFEGRGGDDLGTEIANTLARIFNKGSLDLKSLCISPREHCWVLYVDVLLLECGGNLFDAISIAVKAALFNTRIPRVHVLEDEEGSKEIELSDDPYDCIQLSVENVPCIITLCKIGYRHVVDATLQEEACSLASLLVSVTNKGVVTCMRKVGKGSLDPESIFEMMETGERVGKALHSSLQSLLHKEESLGPKRQKVGFLG
uniref:Exosome component 7 n=1 Tax=Oryctolagus cuniculus TaxID=9986 RepID=A0A5F9CY57_RABIT